MEDVYEHERATLDQFGQAFSTKDMQTGAVFSINGRVKGIELFGTSGVFTKYLGKLVRSYAMDAIEEERERVEQPSDAAAKRFINDLLKVNASTYQAVGEGEDVRLEGEGLSGGALLCEDQLVHLAAFSRSGPTAEPLAH
jgi:hypothetical protein